MKLGHAILLTVTITLTTTGCGAIQNLTSWGGVPEQWEPEPWTDAGDARSSADHVSLPLADTVGFHETLAGDAQ